jgi:hypothetical protein
VHYTIPVLALLHCVMTVLRFIGRGTIVVIGVAMWEVWPWLLFFVGFILGFSTGREGG